MRPHLRTVLIALLTIALMAFFLRNADLARVWVEIRQARLDLLGLAMLVTALTYVVRAVRWQYLLRPIGGARLRTALRATVMGFAASFLLPARAGEFLRPYLLARREGLSAMAAFATIIVERLLDLLSVLVLLVVFLAVFDPGFAAVEGGVFSAVKLGGLAAATGGILALGMVFVLAGRPGAFGRAALVLERVLPAALAEKVARFAGLFVQGLGVMRQPGGLFKAVALSLPLWLCLAAGVWLTARAFQIALPFPGSFLILALLVVGVSVPTPGAIGGFHAAFQIGVTTFYGATTDQAVGAALVLHALSVLPITLIGLVFMAQEGVDLARMRRLAAFEPAAGSGPAEGAGGEGRPDVARMAPVASGVRDHGGAG